MKRLLGLMAVCALAAWSAEFRAQDFGAKGDGKTLDTVAIQKTIDAAAKAGDGTVVFAPGVYLIGSLFLKSGTHLRVDAGVELHGVRDQAAYPIMATRVAGVEMEWPAALINVYRQNNVSITGKGTIDGDGKLWWDKYWKMRREDYEPRGLRWAADYDCQRPRLIQIFKSTNVKVEGVTLKRSGFWTLHICYSQKVIAGGVTIRNNDEARGPSTDGIDIDSSSEITVQHCDIECNDDAICLKAGRDADGLRVNRASHHILIQDNTVRAGAAGVTFGSETSGGIHDVEVSGLHVLPTVTSGILFKSASTRGGTIENVNIHDVTVEGVNAAIAITFNWNPSYSYAKMPDDVKNPPAYWKVLTEAVPPEKGMPHLRNVRISDLKATGVKQAFNVASYKDSPLENVQLKNISVEARTAGSIQNARNWSFANVRIHAADGSVVTVKDSTGISGLTEK